MIHRYSILLIFTLLCLTATGLQAQNPFTNSRAILSGQQQAFPVVTTATGQATLQILDEGEDNARIVVTGTISDLSSPLLVELAGGAHLHVDYPGRNDEIIQPLVVDMNEDSLGGTLRAEDNTFPLPAEMVDLELGQLYLNVHTEDYPGGEIRGIFGQPERQQFFANLFGSNEVPSVVSQGYGAIWFDFDPSDNSLFVTGSYKGLSSEEAVDIAGGIHLHIGLPGENGPVELPLTFITDTDRPEAARVENRFILTPDQIMNLQQGRMYVNLHTKKFRGGEIRGQVLPIADVIFRAHMSGANEWPVVTTRASGEVLAHLNGDSLKLVGSFSGLSAPVATSIGGGFHLHIGWAGENGPVIIPLNGTLNEDKTSGEFTLANNAFKLDAAQRRQLLDRGIYLNIHSENYPAGEIRGQMIPEAQVVFTAFLTGNQQIPSVITTGRGMVKVELTEARMTATGSYLNLTSDLNTAIGGGAHLHAGYPGQSGPVIFPLDAASDADDARSGRFLPAANTFMSSDGTADTLYRRFFYVNIHSLDHPGGEIRGQVLAEAMNYFLAPLSGASQPAGVPTDATGMVAAELRDTTVTLVGSFQDLDSDFNEAIAGGMHLHRNIAGSNGGILQSMATELDDDNRSGVVLADSNVFQFTQAQLAEMLDRRVYINVHTADYPSGAIRGQVLPLAQTYLHTTFSGANATNYVQTTAQGGLKLELTDSLLMVSGSVTMLEGEFDYSIAGGAHLHLAPAGQNGPITLPLSADTLDAGRSAIFSVDSNTYMLTTEQVTALRSGRVYANIHTTEVGSGEARGQIRGELNLPPLASRILAPLDGDTLAIGGSNQQPFRVNYAPTTDPDGDTVIYVWQLAADADFDSVLFAANTGRDTFFETNFGTVATLLDSAGVNLGDTATLYHRVLASDGSNYRPSAGVSIKLGRDSIVGTRDFLPLGFAVRAYPNPLREGQSFTYEIATQEAFTGRLLLYTQLGQLQQDRVVDARVGEQRVAVDMSSLPSGTYFLMLRNSDGRLINTARVVVQ